MSLRTDIGIRRLGSIRKFCVLIEGPVAIIDVSERLQRSILNDIPFSKPDLANAAIGRFFEKVKKLLQRLCKSKTSQD